MEIFEQLSPDPKRGVTLAQQLKQQITWLIAGGQLKPGDRLPTVRKMADQLSINLHTVRNAYHKLEADGLVETRQGRGTHVSHFDPTRLIQRTHTQRSHTIGVIVPTITNPFYHRLIQGVEEVTDSDQSLLFVSMTHDDPFECWRYFAQLSARQVDGIIVASHDVFEIFPKETAPVQRQEMHTPLVTVDWPDVSGYSVQLDLENAGYLATRHLLDHGHQLIGMITWIEDIPNVRAIETGYQRALQEKGLAVDPTRVARVSGFDLDSGQLGALQIMALRTRPSAIFAITDLLAIGAMQVIRSLGLAIPQDVALVGFNDIPQAVIVEPALTTVTAPAMKLGMLAMEMLQQIIAGQTPTHQRLVVPVDLVVRQSCGCPASHPLV